MESVPDIGSEKVTVLERFFTPYQTGCAVAGDRIAVIAPHPDDEVFGCGASICKWLQQGKAVQVFVLTEGVLMQEFADQPEAQQQRQAKIEQRAQESLRAANVLGTPNPIFLPGQDGELWYDHNIEQALHAQLQAWQPTTLVAPSIWEMHRDHRAAAEITLRLAAQLTTVEAVTLYEVGVPLLPNVIEDVSAYQASKWQAMQCFTSQLAGQHYAQQIAGLNIYRTYTLGREVAYAEAFHSIAAQQIERFIEEHAPERLSLVLRQAEQATLDHAQQLQQVQQDRDQLQAQLQQLYVSHSWRITQPLRWLRNKIGL